MRLPPFRCRLRALVRSCWLGRQPLGATSHPRAAAGGRRDRATERRTGARSTRPTRSSTAACASLRGLRAGGRSAPARGRRRAPGGAATEVQGARCALDGPRRRRPRRARRGRTPGRAREPPSAGWSRAGSPAAACAVLAALDGVRSVRPAERGETRTGASRRRATSPSRADPARGRFGVDRQSACASASSRTASTEPRCVTREWRAAGRPDPLVPSGCSAGSGSEGTRDARDRRTTSPPAPRCCSRAASTARCAFVDAVACLRSAGAERDRRRPRLLRRAVLPGRRPRRRPCARRSQARRVVPHRRRQLGARALRGDVPAVPASRSSTTSATGGGVDNTQRRVDPSRRLAALRAAVGRSVRHRRRRLRPAPASIRTAT